MLLIRPKATREQTVSGKFIAIFITSWMCFLLIREKILSLLMISMMIVRESACENWGKFSLTVFAFFQMAEEKFHKCFFIFRLLESRNPNLTKWLQQVVSGTLHFLLWNEQGKISAQTYCLNKWISIITKIITFVFIYRHRSHQFYPAMYENRTKFATREHQNSPSPLKFTRWCNRPIFFNSG